MYAITRSVGAWSKGAVNLLADVKTVQTMLRKASIALRKPSLDPKAVDGVVSRTESKSATIKAIVAFQRLFSADADGLIEVNGRTWQRLLDAVDDSGSDAEVEGQPMDECFPFPVLPAESWTTGARRFASNRQGGQRAHAGSDLYFPQGTVIYAMAAGKVVRGPYAFYAETYALEVDHGSYLARYGEVQANAFVSAGQTVRAGQKLARVGHLVGIDVPSDMLHLEIYGKTESGPLTVPKAKSKLREDGVPFLRRRDLLDPTPLLNRLKTKLPKP